MSLRSAVSQASASSFVSKVDGALIVRPFGAVMRACQRALQLQRFDFGQAWACLPLLSHVQALALAHEREWF